MLSSRKLKNLLPILGLVGLLFIACSASPLKKEQSQKEGNLGDVKAPLQTSSGSGRTLKDTMDSIKDMFDFGQVTWVPLGRLIFGNKDENIGWAKWPSKNKDNSNSDCMLC